MRILHLMLACLYIDNYNYQENILPRINKEDGHEVKIIASTETYIDNTYLGYVEPQRYMNEDGIEVVRLAYRKSIFKLWEHKRRAYIGLGNELEKFNPDVIMCHGVHFKDLDVVRAFKQKNPNVVIYADNHADYYNSGQSFASKYVLHKFFYIPIVRRNLSVIKKVLYVSESTRVFMTELYKIPREKTQEFLIGGIVLQNAEYLSIRTAYRDKLNVKQDDIVIMHSGKLCKAKRTKELVEAFINANIANQKLVIIGSISNDNTDLVDLINSDQRIRYLGWKNSEELFGYLAACDIYAQPGTQSVTMEEAACSNCAMMLYPYDDYKHIFNEKALYVKDKYEITDILKRIASGDLDINKVRNDCYKVAKQILDYKTIVKTLYEK